MKDKFISLARQAIDKSISDDMYYSLADFKGNIFDFCCGADILRQHFFQNKVHLCTICNAKSGRCSEDCSFCAQSAYYEAECEHYDLLPKEDLRQGALMAARTPINRYSLVTSGRGLSESEAKRAASALQEINQIKTCASFGILPLSQLQSLREMGISRYHHNLETAPSFFDKVCSTHSFSQRVDTILSAKQAGLSVCSGGIFGLGETDRQVVELGLLLKKLNVDSVPVNFLVPVQGTPLQSMHALSPLRCLKIIALLRYILPDKEIIVCGGREYNLRQLHAFVFFAGASGIMTGNYLTTAGRTLDKDLELLDQLGLEPRSKE